MKFLIAFIAWASAFGVAIGATLNFDSLGRGQIGMAANVPGARILMTSEGTIYAYKSGDYGMPTGGGVCAVGLAGTCTGGLTILFIGPTANLSFTGYFAQPNEGALVTAYSGLAPIATRSLHGNGSGLVSANFKGVSGITRVAISDASTPGASGIAYGSFTYDAAPPASVVVPPPVRRSLDFGTFALGEQKGPLQFKDLIVAGLNGSGLFVYHSGSYGMPAGGGVCALASNYTCTGDLELAFLVPVSGLTFDGYFAAPTDSVLVSLFSGGKLLTSQQFWGNASNSLAFDFSAYSRVDLVTILDRSSIATKGMAFGNFQYSYWQPPKVIPVVQPPPPPPPVQPPTAAVALPGSAVFLMSGLFAGLLFEGFGRRARKYRSSKARS